eukprot:CAMPEP_0185756698 /NCGR_PEP_ID=MMETSP1174-20130828/15118_1 /TAXON_ID=35687 /ORGANISM="Dictyocha speculum, Strain CCMP1381" /LENGTH=71 /DNA_ID=CAMNT_0028435781 /DNA_START=106 /DNA_END=321 /DNA_ORIENTATION=+
MDDHVRSALAVAERRLSRELIALMRKVAHSSCTVGLNSFMASPGARTVQAYELKVRLQHVIERLRAILEVA